MTQLVMIVITALIFSIVLYQWYRTARFYGYLPFHLVSSTIRYAIKSNKAFLFYLALFYPLIGLGSYFLMGFPLIAVVPLSVFAISTLLYLSLPPSVLLLSHSIAGNSNLVSYIGGAVLPLRFVHLLQPKINESDYFTDETFELDSIRKSSDSSWESVVYSLMDSVPIVVVDTRTAKGHIVTETARMLHPSRQSKGIFIINDDGSSPVLDRVVKSGNRPNIRVVTFNQLRPFLRLRIRQRR